MVASILATKPDQVIANGGAYVGTPDEVIGQIERSIEAFGEIEPSMQVNFGGSRTEEALATIELFAEKVMPRFPDAG
jgi:alkanesulfonate monooxygenase SsuD/methylene tetrahydromethanopterin reductase-like flavin-dependent oxidoreductase (luciferase family)